MSYDPVRGARGQLRPPPLLRFQPYMVRIEFAAHAPTFVFHSVLVIRTACATRPCRRRGFSDALRRWPFNHRWLVLLSECSSQPCFFGPQ